MSIYKTYKNLHSRGTINGKRYILYEYTTFYIPFDYLNTENGHVLGKNADLSNLVLTKTYELCSTCWKDQYGNKWFKDGSMTGGKYMAYCEDKALTSYPMDYYSACQLISKDAGLEKKEIYGSVYYNYCYNYMGKIGYKDESKGEYIPNYETMFNMPFKVGDRIFYVREHDDDTRCGRRTQIHTMIIESIVFEGDEYILYNYDRETCNHCSFDHCSVPCYRAYSNVDELMKVYKGTLYMWHHCGGVAIEECRSGADFMRYLDKQTE